MIISVFFFLVLTTHNAMNEEELALAVKINRRLVQLCVDARNLGPQTVRRYLLAAMRVSCVERRKVFFFVCVC